MAEHWALAVIGWLADHSPPVIAGFLGGILGAEARGRWRARGRSRREAL